jgi:hypothetical protein
LAHYPEEKMKYYVALISTTDIEGKHIESQRAWLTADESQRLHDAIRQWLAEHIHYDGEQNRERLQAVFPGCQLPE